MFFWWKCKEIKKNTIFFCLLMPFTIRFKEKVRKLKAEHFYHFIDSIRSKYMSIARKKYVLAVGVSNNRYNSDSKGK